VTKRQASEFFSYSTQFTYSSFDFANTQWWSPFNYLGVGLSVPLTANFRNYNTLQDYRYKTQQLDLDLKQKTADINYEIEKATTELDNALRNMKATKANYDLSKSIYVVDSSEETTV
jgi:outer membrane protein TolC